MEALLVVPQDGSMAELSQGEAFKHERILARIQPLGVGMVGVDLVSEKIQKAYLLFPLSGPQNVRAEEIVAKMTGAHLQVTGDAAFVMSLEDAVHLLHQGFTWPAAAATKGEGR